MVVTISLTLVIGKVDINRRSPARLLLTPVADRYRVNVPFKESARTHAVVPKNSWDTKIIDTKRGIYFSAAMTCIRSEGWYHLIANPRRFNSSAISPAASRSLR
jgi:hypothetical protein